VSDTLANLGLTLRQDFQAWLTQLQLDDLGAEHSLSDQIDQLYQLAQDLTAYEQMSESWRYWEVWLTSGFLPSDAGGVDFLPSAPPVPNFPPPHTPAPTLPLDRHPMGYSEHRGPQGFDPIDPMVSGAPNRDPTSMTSGWASSSPPATPNRNQRLFADGGVTTPAILGRAVGEPIMPDRPSPLSMPPDLTLAPPPPSRSAALELPPSSSGEAVSLPLESFPASTGVDLAPEFTLEPPAGSFSHITPAVKGIKDLSDFLQQTRSDILNVAPAIEANVAPRLRHDPPPQQSPQLDRSQPWMDAAESTLPVVANQSQEEKFGRSSTHGSIAEAARLPMTVENAADFMWQQIKINAITGKFDSPVEPVTVEPVTFESLSEPRSEPRSELIDPPLFQPSSAPRLGQTAMSLHEPSYPAASPQAYANLSVWTNPPHQEDGRGWANDWTQDQPSPAAQWLEPAPLPFPPGQPDPGLPLSPLAKRPPKALPRRAIAPQAGPVARPEPSGLDLDRLLEALQQEINQEYDRFYGS
jgi:hypothetical protein